MPDYNLGRAFGEVVITADTAQATRAMGEYESATDSATDSARQQSRVEQELTERRRVATEVSGRRRAAEAEYRRVMADSTSTTEEQVRAEENRNRIRGEHLQAARRAADAERAYRAQVVGNTAAVDRFVQSLDRGSGAGDRHSRSLLEQSNSARRFRGELDGVTKSMSGLLSMIAKVGAIGTGGLAAGGLVGLLGAGGAQGAISAIAGVVAVVTQLSGTLLLLPGVIAGAGVSIAALKIGLTGISESFKNFDDPEKFAEGLNKLAPAAQSVMKELQAFNQVFKGAQQTIQQSLFEPLMDDIRPLVSTLLPLLTDGLYQVARVIGEAGSEFAGWLRSTQTLNGLYELIQNVKGGLSALVPAIKPFATALLTIARVGSGFFVQLADSIVKAANSFANWTEKAAGDGSMQRWIQAGITGFQQLWSIIKNIGVAIGNVFSFSGGGDILGTIKSITAEFRAWTESTSGRNELATFFGALKTAGANLMPILKSIGGTIWEVVKAMVGIGNGIAPGALDFFQSLGAAVKELAPSLIASAPAIGSFLKTVGEIIKVVVGNVGSSLPEFFKSFSDAAKNLVTPIDLVTQGLGALMGSLSPQAITGIATVAAGLQALSSTVGGVSGLIGIFNAGKAAVAGVSAAFTFLTGPVGLVAIAIAALIAVVVLIATHWDETKAAASALWDTLKEFGSWIGGAFVAAWNGLVNAVKTSWANIKSTVSESVAGVGKAITDAFSSVVNGAYDWGKNIIGRMIEGIKSMFQPLSDAMDWLMGEGIDDKTPSSPPKSGPLSGQGDPLLAGQRIGERLATGIESSEGTVSSASDKMVGGVGGSYTSAGVAGKSGRAGKSGFEQWVNQLTGELGQLSAFAEGAFNLFKDVFEIFGQTTKVVASLWNGGDNPLTRAGGIAADPDTAPGEPGKAPLSNLVPKGADNKQETGVDGYSLPPASAEQNAGAQAVKDNPNLDAKGNAKSLPQNYPRTESGKPIGAPTGLTATPATPTAAPSAGSGGKPLYSGAGQIPLVQNEDGTWTSSNPEWAKLIKRESGGNPKITQGGYEDENSRSGDLATGLFQITGGTWRGNGGEEFGVKDAKFATPEQQAIVAARIFAARGGQPWGSGKGQNFGREDEDLLRAGLTTSAPPAPTVTGGNAMPAGIVRAPNGAGYLDAQGNRVYPANLEESKAWEKSVGNPTPTTSPKRTMDASAFGGVDLKDDSSGLNIGSGASQGAKPAPASPPAVRNGMGLTATKGAEYGVENPDSRTEDLPPWVKALGDAFGIGGSTYHDHQTNGAGGHIASGEVEPNPMGLNRGIDWWPMRDGKQYTDMSGKSYTKEENDRLTAFSKFLADNNLAEQVIYRNPMSKEEVGFPFNADYEGNYGGHEGHSHTRFAREVLLNGAQASMPQGTQASGLNIGTGAQGPQGQKYDPNKPMIGTGAQPVPGVNSTVDQTKPWLGSAADGNRTPVPNQNTPGGDASTNIPGVNAAPPTDPKAAAKSPLDQALGAAGGAGSIASDAFAIFNDVLKNIDAVAGLTDTLVRGPENSEDIMRSIDQLQTFLTTAADVAKLVSSVAATAGTAGGADPTGGASAALGAVSAISQIVQSGITAVNQGIDLGQEAYRIVSKYGAMFAGIMLGGAETGPLGGNVRMLLNTATGEVYSYSQDNPEQKNVKNLPSWLDRSYGGTREQPVYQQTQVNLYTGAGAQPNQLISDTMWLVNNGAATTSVAASD